MSSQVKLLREKPVFPQVNTPEELAQLLRSGKRGFMNVQEDVYHSGPGLNQSMLKGYAKTPAHAKMMMDGMKFSSDAMRLGTACHASVFEPSKFNDEYATGPECDRRTKEGKSTWSTFIDANPGRKLLSLDDAATIRGIVSSLKTHPYFEYISGGHGFPELSYYWESLGNLCKGRFDWITSTDVPLDEGQERIIFDLKTTEYGVSKEDCERTIKGLGYHIQAAWYLTGVPDANFVFIFAEKKPPYAVTFYQVGPQMREKGHEEVERLLGKHLECVAKRSWPSHDGSVIVGD